MISKKLSVVYLENYSVTLSEYIMPASEVSEQISLAGTEAKAELVTWEIYVKRRCYPRDNGWGECRNL